MIAVTGIDGCGKTTICNSIQKIFLERGISSAIIQPYHYTIPTSKIMREAVTYIKSNAADNITIKNINPVQEAMGFRYIIEHEEKVNDADIIIFDRYVETLYVRHKQCEVLDKLLIDIKKPDKYYVIDVKPQECMERILKRGNVNSKIENLNELTKTYTYYADNCSKFGFELSDTNEILDEAVEIANKLKMSDGIAKTVLNV